MFQSVLKYSRLIPLPILLFVMGICTLPFSSGIKVSYLALAEDAGLHLLFAAAASTALEWRIRNYPTKVLAIAHATFLSFIIAALVFVIVDLFLVTLIFSNKDYLQHIDDTETMRFVMTWLCLGWVGHITVLRKNQLESKKDWELHQQAVTSLREAELFKLRQQLQPHFLYNSLNSINALIQLDAEKAQEMVGKLSDFLRLSVKRDTSEQISIQDELSYIEAYLAIESVRFGNRLSVDIIKQGEELEKAHIPAFILQPIVENAIKFGLYGNTGKVSIRIELGIRDKMLHILLENPYDPSLQPPRGTGYGLEGISRRLHLLYARTDLLEIKKTDNIFSTIVKIPQ
ncbi:MAG: histidine kinase [Chitinophagaceae bacterium]